MRIFKLELKRVFNTRITWILLALSLFLSVWMAYLPTTFSDINYTDENGNQVKLTGLDSLHYRKTVQADTAGEVTPAKIHKALEAYQTCLKEYGVEDIYELPEKVYVEKLLPYAPLMHGVKEAYANPDTGIAPSILDIPLDKTDDFYAACDDRIVSLMKMEQKDHPAAQEKAVKMYQQVEKPFVNYPGASSEAMDYLLMLSFLILLFCTMIAAPVFSSDYQTGADDILRCTKYGRIRLGVVKIVSALGICGTAFLLCAAVYLIVSNSLFGWECTKTSMQILYSIVGLANLNMGQLQLLTAAAGLLSILASVSFTLFISSRAENTLMSIAVSLFFCFLPVVIYMMIPGTVELWLRCLLPAAGLGLQSSFLYTVIDFDFLNIGNFAVWMPYAMIAFTVIEIPLFIGLTLHSYSSRRMR